MRALGHSSYLGTLRHSRHAISTVSGIAFFFVSAIAPAHATIDNTATVTGTPRAGTLPPSITADESVDVVDANPLLGVVKSYDFASGGDVNSDGNYDVGDVVEYSYVVTNTGNVTITDITIADTHDGSGSLVFATPSFTTDNGTAAAGQVGDSSDDGADTDYDSLGPLDVVTFTSTYTITQADFDAGGGGAGAIGSKDNDLDNSAVANGTYNGDGSGTSVASTASLAEVPLDIVPGLTATKVASAPGFITGNIIDAPVGTTITYTYEIQNTGNVAVRNIDVSDSHQGSGTAPLPSFDIWVTNTGSTVSGSTITYLAVGDIARFTATYTVTQDDVDTLQ